MAEAFHARPFKHRVRRRLLRGLSHIPVSTGKGAASDKILLIRPDHLGDVLLTLPAIHALRRARPRAEIHALVGAWSAHALAHSTELDAIITLPFPGFTRGEKEGTLAPYRLALRTAGQLRKIGYESAVIMRHDHWWAGLVTFLAGIPTRIGYDHDELRHFLTSPIETHHEHAVLKNLRLLRQWTGKIPQESIKYQFFTVEDDQSYIQNRLDEWQIQPEEPIICIHPGSGTWVKRWDAGNWAQAADMLASQYSAKVVFTGGDQELPMVQAITEKMRHKACILAGNTTIGQLAALYERAIVVLGPDSGPLHLAAAVDTPTVALFGPADPVEFAPWGSLDQHAVLTSHIDCLPCKILDWGGDNPDFHPCVRDITVSRVLEATKHVIREVARPTH